MKQNAMAARAWRNQTAIINTTPFLEADMQDLERIETMRGKAAVIKAEIEVNYPEVATTCVQCGRVSESIERTGVHPGCVKIAARRNRRTSYGDEQ